MLKHVLFALGCAACLAEDKPNIQASPKSVDDIQVVSPISSRKPLFYYDKDGSMTVYYDDKARKIDPRKPTVIMNSPEVSQLEELKKLRAEVQKATRDALTKPAVVIREKSVAPREKDVIVVQVIHQQQKEFEAPVRHSLRARRALELSDRAEEACHAAQGFMEDCIRREKAEAESRRNLPRKFNGRVRLSGTVGHSEGRKESGRRVEGGSQDSLSSDEEEISEDERDEE